MKSLRFKNYIKKHRKRIDSALEKYLPKSSQKPGLIHEAMRYSIFAGGKRLRPILVIAGAEACGGKAAHVMPTACAMELIHTYSLIHDDLPAMDNDDLRRGRPTSHKVYGEDMAILAGDALLTHAFSLIQKNATIKGIKTTAIPPLLDIVTKGAGTAGMIGGQVADIKADNGKWKKIRYGHNGNTYYKDEGQLLSFIHHKKTAALISASLEAGGCLAGGTPKQQKALRNYGRAIGLAFQVRDDILDRIGDKKKLGKKGSDEANQKLTYPALYGLEKSESMAKNYIRTAHRELKIFGSKAQILHDLADYVLSREN